MPPPKGTAPWNPLEVPGDYDVTETVHSDTYPAIDPTKLDLSGKAVLVTGGSKGIGKATVLSFVKAGASYIAAGARSDMSDLAREVESAAKSANRKPPQFLPVKLDVGDQQSITEAAATVEKAFGRLDVLVNNAGIFYLSPIADSDPDQWWRIWEINVRGPYLMSRAFLPLLLKSGGGYIINTASCGAHLKMPSASAYQTSKTALVRFTEFINAEYADKGIISFSYHPGNIPTEILGDHAENLDPNFVKTILVDKVELSADTLAFLTSEKRDWLGGRYINVYWDMPELLQKVDEIVKEDKLKIKFVY